ncbi:MAG: cytochrome c biogenesis protein CcsA [Planctomycetaceae bacterium]|nr:cytochrome c biogenesis protein CcsA [Planctomycetaceae bacterium]
MATPHEEATQPTNKDLDLQEDSLLHQTDVSEGWSLVQTILAPLASLKLTVVLLLLGIFIVLVGTLAQVKADIWAVINDYFRSSNGEFFVWIRPSLFFPPAFFPDGAPQFPDYLGFWFPKGWVIGFFMLLNLAAAHLVRFKVQAKGIRLGIGILTLAAGIVLTTAVILGGSGTSMLDGDALMNSNTVWTLSSLALMGLCGLCAYAAAMPEEGHWSRRGLFIGLAAVCGAASLYGLKNDPFEAYVMRILHQLLTATLASTVLMAGCVLIFKKRGGIVLIHAGIGLMMAYEVLVGLQHIESQMRIEEGQTVTFSRDIREAELVVIDSSDPEEDTVTAIPASRLQAGKTIQHELLPFDIQVVDYFPNSDLRAMASFQDGEEAPKNPATKGMGTRFVTFAAAPAAGTDSGGNVDVPAGYVQLLPKQAAAADEPDGELGTYLITAFPDMAPGMLDETQSVQLGEKTYELALRYKRIYHPYAITLKDVQKNDYKGTNNARDYSSYIEVEQDGTAFNQRIWMNNPMRFAGSTFYQSSYIPAGAMGRSSREITVLQVVANRGWMAPYVACMMVVVGMFGQFGATLLRYLDRRDRARDRERKGNTGGFMLFDTHVVGFGIGALLAVISVGYMIGQARVPAVKPGEFDLARFGQLPMWYRGRAMPIDTYARNTLLQLADRETFGMIVGDAAESSDDSANVATPDADDEATQGAQPVKTKRAPAIRWLLDVMTDEEAARKHRVIRIENSDVINSLGLEDHRAGLVYSLDELGANFETLAEQAQAAAQVPAKERSLREKKLVELANKVVLASFVEMTMGRPPELPNQEQFGSTDPRLRREMFSRFLAVQRDAIEEFRTENRVAGPSPLLIPMHLGVKSPEELPRGTGSDWDTLSSAHVIGQYAEERDPQLAPAIVAFEKILKAYKEHDADRFNSALTEYQQLLEQFHAKLLTSEESDADLPLARVDAEAQFNRQALFTNLSIFYVLVLVLAFLGWIIVPEATQRAAFVLALGLLGVYTYAIYMRMYISGRPPVTNLYSSAVFIGWGTVVGGLIMESLTWKGLGNVIAAATGFAALRIADGLATDGDTIAVMEAVLDTQFWLATHVVCITLGYSATFLAGALGILYLCAWPIPGLLDKEREQTISRNLYATLCFATFFSFFGTVLGGLWADDSWGRFWGWDPKENGALIIVLWNAVILHARWGAMIKGRGMAVLATLGNIVVAWSWFGVNELGVGLHSYGFTEGRLRWLALFIVSQILLAALGVIPRGMGVDETQPSSEELTSAG